MLFRMIKRFICVGVKTFFFYSFFSNHLTSKALFGWRIENVGRIEKYLCFLSCVFGREDEKVE